MSTTNPPVAQRQQSVAVSGWPGYFSTKTGGEVTADVADVWDGGWLTPTKLAGPASTANVVLSRPYRPATHATMVKAWSKRVGRQRTTISIWNTDPDLGRIGSPTVYADALLVRLTPPDYDAASSDAAMIEMEFAVAEGA